MKARLIGFCLACLLALAATAQTAVIYVGPSGDDKDSGETPTTAVATIARAVERSREARNAPGDAVKIILRGGIHLLDAPIDLEPGDSGLEFQAAHGEFPIISGGARIVGWKADATNSNVWEALVPAARDGKWNFHELFVNGHRRQRARWPKTGFLHIAGLSPTNHPTELPVRVQDFDPAWAQEGDVELIALQAWAQSRNQIRSLNPTNGMLSLAGDVLPNRTERDGRYYLENVPGPLVAGEWRLESGSGVVRYMPEPGEDMNRVEVWAPRLTTLVRLKGSSEHVVKNIVFHGVTFADTDWPFDGGNDMDIQTAIESHGAVQGEWTRDCAIEQCTFTRLGGWAVDFAAGCERTQIVGNEMHDLGAGGVRLGDIEVGRAFREATRENVISDNHIHDIGKVNMPAAGILVLLSGQNLIAHNEVDHTYEIAISVGWAWGYAATPCRENIVEFNHLHDVGQGMFSDMGGIYTLGLQPGTILRDNLIHDVNDYKYGGWGIYTDEGSTGIIIESNIVYHCNQAGFHQHYGRENIIRNNVFAFNRVAQLARTRVERHLSLSFSNNIVYFDSGDLLTGNWGDDLVMNNNLYFDTRGTNATLPNQLKLWRARGHDTNSIVADPMFADPEHFDFRVSPYSPASRVGFHPFTLDGVGPRPGILRTGVKRGN